MNRDALSALSFPVLNIPGFLAFLNPRCGTPDFTRTGMIEGFSWVGKFDKYFFGWFDLYEGVFLGSNRNSWFKTILRFMAVPELPGHVVLWLF